MQPMPLSIFWHILISNINQVFSNKKGPIFILLLSSFFNSSHNFKAREVKFCMDAAWTNTFLNITIDTFNPEIFQIRKQRFIEMKENTFQTLFKNYLKDIR